VVPHVVPDVASLGPIPEELPLGAETLAAAPCLGAAAAAGPDTSLAFVAAKEFA
jgi:hypothetical protein